MIYITQLIYVNGGQEGVFHEFESYAIPIIKKYDGELMLRIRPDAKNFIETSVEQPYEIHIVRFNSQQDFDNFLNDEERAKYLGLKVQSIRESFLIKGEAL